MKTILALCLAAALAGCASFDGRGLVAGQSTAAEVEKVMGPASEKRQQANGESWLYFSRQPYGRKTYVARIAPDGKLIAIEQRLTDEYVARLVKDKTTADEVRNLFGPPYYASHIARMNRNTWSWHMRRFGDPGIPVGLHVQMSPDGIVREVYLLDESDSERPEGVALGIGSGGRVGVGLGIGF